MRDPVRRRALLRLWAAGTVFVGALAAAGLWQLQRSEEAAMRAAETLVEHQLASAEAGLNRLLMGVDLGLASLADPLAQALGADGRPLAAAARRLVEQLDQSRLEITEVALIDAEGATLAASLPAPAGHGHRLPPGLLARVLGAPVPQFFVSAPVVSAATAEPVLLMGRPLRLPGGQRLVAVAQVPTAALASLLGRMAEGVEVTVELDDGLLLATVPPNDPLVGTRLSPPLQRDASAAAPRRATSRHDAVPALVASRAAVYPEVQLSVSYRLSDALAGWRGERDTVLAVMLAMMALALAAGALVHWTVVRLARARSALARSGTMLDQALAAMADGFLLCDAADRVVRWNDRYAEMFPWLRPVLAVGVPYRRLAEVAAATRLPAASAAERQAWVDHRMAFHQGQGGHWSTELDDGRSISAVERRLPDGGVVGIYHDVTAAERRLAQAKVAAEAANQAKSQFLATMSHELRTPLNAVLGLNALMLRSPLSAQQRRHAELIHSSGQLLLSIITDVLDLAKIEAGRLSLEPAPFDARRAAEEVVALLRERADEKGLRLVLEVAPSVPPCVENDPARVRQVMFNLIGNALKFTDRGRVEVRLRCDDAAPGRTVLVLEVADTGIGIAPEALPRLFQRFTQVDGSAARRHGGSGLGLAISREFVTLMGGRLDVHSRPGEGSTFTARMPCRTVAERPAAEAPPPRALPAPGAHSPLRVLAAEDNPVNQFVIQAMLDSLGHHCEVVPDGAAAVRRVREGGVDLVLLDLQMPVLDGEEAARQIRALPGAAGRTPLVAMTANVRVEDREACVRAGMDGFVVKPVDRDALASAMADAVARRRARVAA